MPTSLSEGLGSAIAQTERALLGSVLLVNTLWPQTCTLSADDFSLDTHRKVYARMAAMFEDQRPVDLITLTEDLARLNQLENCGDPAYVSSLIDHAIPENIAAYIRSVRNAAIERRVARHIELLATTCSMQSPRKIADLREQARCLLDSLNSSSSTGESLGHSYEEIVNVPPVSFAVDGFLQEQGVTLIGGLSGHGKTLIMLATVRALLEGGKLFHHFRVNSLATKVIYLIPECGLAPFAHRLKVFGLMDHVRDGRLIVRTLSKKPISLNSPLLLREVPGADVFLDTAVRFKEGDENGAAENNEFAESLFNLQRAGARTISGAHHAPKSFARDTFMTLENILRGTGDIGAMLCTCWGIRQVDSERNRIYVQNVKPRDFLPCEPFIIQGRPSLDTTGYFELTDPPGFAGELGELVSRDKGGRPAISDEKAIEALRLSAEGKSQRQIADKLDVGLATVNRWLRNPGKVQ